MGISGPVQGGFQCRFWTINLRYTRLAAAGFAGPAALPVIPWDSMACFDGGNDGARAGSPSTFEVAGPSTGRGTLRVRPADGLPRLHGDPNGATPRSGDARECESSPATRHPHRRG